MRDSAVYVLQFEATSATGPEKLERNVRSIRLDHTNKAGTASEILRDVLGVPVTLPEWAEEDIKRIADSFEMQSLNAQTLGALRQRLDEAGLGEYYPDALSRIARRQ